MAKTIMAVHTATADNAEDFRPEYAPDGRIKDPVKQAANLKAKQDKWLTEKSMFNALSAKIIGVSFLRDPVDFPPSGYEYFHFFVGEAMQAHKYKHDRAVIFADEGALLYFVAEILNGNKRVQPFADYFSEEDIGTLCGSNLHGFHLPMLIRRAAMYRIPLPLEYRPDFKGYYDPEVTFDTFDAWGKEGREYISASKLARFFGYDCTSLYLNEPDTFIERLDVDPKMALDDVEEGLRTILNIADSMEFMTR